MPRTNVRPDFPAPGTGETALPSMSVVMAEIPGLGESDICLAHRPSAPSALALSSSFGSFGDDASGEEGLLFYGAEFFHAGLGRGDGEEEQPRTGGTASVSTGVRFVDDVPGSSPPQFPPVTDAALQRKYVSERLAWHACFLDWGVSWEDNLHAEMAELFTKAKDISPFYIVHYALAKVTRNAPATRDGIQEWLSCLLHAGTQGIPVAVAQPLCRVRRAHVLTVISAAYAKHGFNLPESLNVRPIALRFCPQERSPSVMPPSRDLPCAPSSPPEPLRAKHIAPVAQNVNVARCRSPNPRGKSVVKSAARVEDVKTSEEKGRHDRTMVRMMTAVGVIL